METLDKFIFFKKLLYIYIHLSTLQYEQRQFHQWGRTAESQLDEPDWPGNILYLKKYTNKFENIYAH